MSPNPRSIAVLLVLALCSATLSAQSTRPRRARRHSPTTQELQEQMQQMHDQLQAEIDALKQQLAARDAELHAVQTNQTAEHAQTATAATYQAEDTAQVKSAIQQTQAETAATASAVTQLKSGVAEVKQQQKMMEHPASIHYKGVTLTPGGFLAGESIWRQRAMNADIYTNFNSTPYNNSGEAHVSEWVPTARQSRLSLLASGKTSFGSLKAFVEGDFLSAGTTSNNLQSNSYTLRLRQAWGQATFGHTQFTGGQMWTLLTEDKKGASPGQEAFPMFFDANLHVGYTYIRQTAFRVSHTFTPAFTLAASLENSQYQFNASNAPSNFFFGAPGAGGGLNNPTASYTNQVAPDVVAKASFDPGFGHYEIGGVLRLFRDRYYPAKESASGATNDTKVGGGLLLNARVPIGPKVQVGAHLLAGDGTGRYGASLLPDITVHPNGTLEPLRNTQGMFSIEAHPTPKLDLFGYAGTEYVQRTYYTNSTGTLVGYAPPTLSNAGCNIESSPTGNNGTQPGASGCAGLTRNLVQGSVGYIYRIYSGPAGKLQYGLAYSYLLRNGWTGIGGAPKATNNFVYTSFRYYLP
ncbi:MAG TPA: hypothetical protein VFE38_11080 [Edaphobacter sp.]|nr:hypothetical protein [Edaphobacter sp.]